MHSILKKIIDQKHVEVKTAKSNRPLEEVRDGAMSSEPARDFLAALQVPDEVSLIAEVKKASPSKGIIRDDFHPVEIARAYQAGGARCISVLTDEHFFKGHLQFLRDVKSAIELPVLRKDFIIDPWQVFEAREAGADAVLLIAECLEANQMIELHSLIKELGMTALVELYDRDNIEMVMNCDPDLVGVNNRDLNTFEVDLQHSISIRQSLPASITFVSESGIGSHAEVASLRAANVDAILVGESLMRSDDIESATKKLLGR